MISIIMPVRNAFPFLEECLVSIINQSTSNWELIAVDDHSNDKSFDLLNQYSLKDHRIKCIQNEGNGIIDALCAGYSCCEGSYITRMDADDIMPSHKLKELKEILCSNGPGCLSTGRVKYISQGQLGNGYKKYESWLNHLCDTNSHYQEIYKECVIPSPCWMMQREDFEKIGGFSSKHYPDDYDLCFRMYKNKINVAPSNKVLHIWRDHNDRTSRNDTNYADNRFLEMKVRYFLEIDYNFNNRLVLWGAGKKGKMIAQLLIEKSIDFDWVTDNNKKIGKHIYKKLIVSQDSISTHNMKSFIVAVANEEDQITIANNINSISGVQSTYFFC